MADAFQTADTVLPRPFEPARAERTLAALAESPGAFVPPPQARAVMASTFGNSPYLARIALRERETLRRLVAEGPRAALDGVEVALRAAEDAADEAEAMVILRRAKRRAALVSALADISGLWSTEDVMLALSRFADAAVSSALRFLLRAACRRDGLPARDAVRLEAECGLVVLAMGKHGAFELNYSSDIDLIVFYDAERFPYRRKDDARAAAVELVRGLVRILSEVTAEGYVFRVDLRLRPDAGATQVAISTAAAEDYYEEMGQNWERAALIKARACAGDRYAAETFLKALTPFIWRRHLDFAAIEDIHSIKRQIHAHAGHGEIAVAGHNIKLGRGGIREIEFFVQTQQLILGGRNPKLRDRGTLAALRALAQFGHVSDQVAAELTHAYRFLRMVEHRLQMIEDEQTHTVPKSAAGLAHIACFSGFANAEIFGVALTHELEIVQGHYAHLFEREPELTASEGNLVFTGVEDDPETIATLAGLGYRDPRHVAGAVRGWHHGRIRATRSARARELLTKLVPAILHALALTADPDAAFAQFDRFLSRLPAGVQLFSLFLANPHLLVLIANIAGSAPRLADTMARAPATLDALLDPGFLGQLPTRAELDRLLREQLHAAAGFEGALDAARRFAREQNFRVGAQIIEGQLRPEEAGPAFTDIAESVIAALLSAVEDELAKTAGRVRGGAFAVIAMGKLGGREMTASSDLDLIFVYEAPEGIDSSDSTRPLAVSAYYARLAQRLIAALTAATAEGGLYEVDMRLRPTGSKGPVAVSFESFRRYHAESAWTWEHMALTRARVIAGAPFLARRVEAAIREALVRPRTEVARDARDMREKLAAQFPGRTRWDLKFAPGGLVDIEFLAQTLQLEHAHTMPQLLHPNTIRALKALAAAQVLAASEAATLIAAALLQQALTQVLRIAVVGTLDADAATAGLRMLLARAAGQEDFNGLEEALVEAQRSTRTIFEKILPAR
jgi:glutamate-ammonia-ligase adenylyltransferase